MLAADRAAGTLVIGGWLWRGLRKAPRVEVAGGE